MQASALSNCPLLVAAWIVVIVIAVGCHSQRPLSEQEVFGRNMKPFYACLHSPGREVSPEEISRLRIRTESLKPGMAPSEVLQVLGWDGYPAWSYASGPTADYTFYFPLGTNACTLVLHYNMVRQPPAFLRGVITGGGQQDLKQ